MIIRLVTLEGLRRLKDRSVSIHVQTMQEQSQKQMAELDDLFQRHCVIAIKEEEVPFTEAELNDLDAIEVDILDTTKTPSKRLRNVLWKLQEQELTHKPDEAEFKEFYRIKMNQLIEMIKNKLQ